MTAINPRDKVDLRALSAAAHRAAVARDDERSALTDRADAIVAAVRSGARLEEIGDAAGITKAAVSVIARRTLEPRTPRGDRYRRRRGTEAALEDVRVVAQRAADVSRRARQAVRERDQLAVAAADERVPTRQIAAAMTMEMPAVRTLIRRRRMDATHEPFGTLAS